VIMVDAYQDITIPFQMSSVEFFTLVKEHLKEDGVMVINMNMRGSGEGNINEYLSDTVGKVFPNIYTVDVAGSTNRELFASVKDDAFDRGLENARMTAGLSRKERSLSEWIEGIYPEMVRYEPGDRVLTDDKAPVELLGMSVIDDIIGEEVAYYKQIYKEQGLKGLLENF